MLNIDNIPPVHYIIGWVEGRRNQTTIAVISVANIFIFHLTTNNQQPTTNMKHLKTYLISLLILLFGITIVPHPASATTAVNQSSCSKEMVFIPGSTFTIGSENKEFFEERSANNVTVDSFCMDRHEVTNKEFAQFVQATGYKTVAERPLSQEQFPSLSEEERAAGSLVFLPPSEGIEQIAYLSWWHWVPGANWQHPYGADSNIEGKENYPVVHIAYEDALAYGNWAGKMLPTEAQW